QQVDIIHMPRTVSSLSPFFPNQPTRTKTRKPLEDPLLLGGLLVALDLLLPLLLRRHAKEQTRVLARLQPAAQVPPVRGVTVVLEVPPARRVRKPVLEPGLASLLHPRFDTLHPEGQRLGRALALAREQPPDGQPRVVPRDDLAAGRLD